jgi:hypothetical protein
MEEAVKGGKKKRWGGFTKERTRERAVEWADCDYAEKATNVRRRRV